MLVYIKNISIFSEILSSLNLNKLKIIIMTVKKLHFKCDHFSRKMQTPCYYSTHSETRPRTAD